ncbi:CinA family protein [Corynebacterium guangdongense]|uniref:Nicotinamide-nucleotide amidase n=1 Tax=Corynebacterium guangdongense TaxID=1783348 RepID=A0ABU1ZX72_9CORY|nr:CinA family protein [Corynebacterium guangdongense]MDR7329537.1 nicotinamide-nucleotide amidase [Corynebacterium guangdongense]WJZ18102.1 Putative competence-damage inducible protein [Corynebacterium guangdongense]
MIPSDQAPARIVTELTRRAETLAFAESLTAGLASATVASVPGASAVLRGGLVTYATDLKHSLAGVDEQLLADAGPVSADTAVAMAEGARRVCGADWGVSLTGVAGPDPQDGHPVGEVFIGIAGPGRETVAVRARAEGHMGVAPGRHSPEPVPVMVGDRSEIRGWSVAAALSELLGAVLSRG